MKNGRMTSSLVIIAALLLVPAALPAQQKGGIELATVAEVEVTGKNAQGEKEVKRMEAALAKVVPGDVVIFTTRYTNAGKEPANSVTIMNPVPEHMTYVDKSAEGRNARIDFSIDGGKTYAAPDKLAITDSQGKKRTAQAREYTHVRWVLTAPLAPGGAGSVSFRAQVK